MVFCYLGMMIVIIIISSREKYEGYGKHFFAQMSD